MTHEEAVNDLNVIKEFFEQESGAYPVSLEYAINVLKNELSADRPQGEWFKDDEGTFICSACGSGYKDQPTIMGKPMFKWCPICGARMKGADDD